MHGSFLISEIIRKWEHSGFFMICTAYQVLNIWTGLTAVEQR